MYNILVLKKIFTEIEEPAKKRGRIEDNVLPEASPQPHVIDVENFVCKVVDGFIKRYFHDKMEVMQTDENLKGLSR